MRLSGRSTGSSSVAFVAAWMLVLQVLLGGFALGAAASPLLDTFGNPLCITSSDAPAAGLGHTEHTTLPDCCTVACSPFAQAANDGRAHSIANPLRAATPRLHAAFDAVGPAFALDPGSGSPRSPPPMA